LSELSAYLEKPLPVAIIGTLVSGILLIFATNWFNQPSDPVGQIMYTVNEQTAPCREPCNFKGVDKGDEYIDIQSARLKFFNLSNDIRDFSISIPNVKFDPKYTEIEVSTSDGTISAVPALEDIDRTGLLELKLAKLKRGGAVELSFRSAKDLSFAGYDVDTSSEEIEIFRDFSAYLFVNKKIPWALIWPFLPMALALGYMLYQFQLTRIELKIREKLKSD
jgi:hypothetical protein